MIKNKFKFYAAIAAISLMLFDGTALAETYRVTVDAAGGGTGLSWESPMTIEEGQRASDEPVAATSVD